MHCFPRIKFGDALLWEPTKLRALQAEGASDEWMYELHMQHQNDTATYSGDTLLAVFNMVDTNARYALIEQKVTSMRCQFEALLTAQDSATLDHLLSVARASERSSGQSLHPHTPKSPGSVRVFT